MVLIHRNNSPILTELSINRQRLIMVSLTTHIEPFSHFSFNMVTFSQTSLNSSDYGLEGLVPPTRED